MSSFCSEIVQFLFRNCSVFVQKNTNDLMQLIENQQTKITPTLEKKKSRIIVQKTTGILHAQTASCKQPTLANLQHYYSTQWVTQS